MPPRSYRRSDRNSVLWAQQREREDRKARQQAEAERLAHEAQRQALLDRIRQLEAASAPEKPDPLREAFRRRWRR